MTWVVIAAFAFASWLFIALLVLGLCRDAARGDETAAKGAGATFTGATRAPYLGATRAPYLSRRESRRSLSSLPSV